MNLIKKIDAVINKYNQIKYQHTLNIIIFIINFE